MSRRTDAGYELLDLGDGRQFARFGELIVDRPYPAAAEPRQDPIAWAAADLRYERGALANEGSWVAARGVTIPNAWPMTHAGLTFELRPTPSGQVGFFGEQIPCWRWLDKAVERRTAPVNVLNLFAYTGGSTLTVARAGAMVTHVDASRSAVAWARRNAELSGRAEAPIRWIVDDAPAFVRREARRGRRYDGIVLDPPSYGHGPDGRRWTLEEQLPDLLDACLVVASDDAFVLLTGHAEGWLPADFASVLAGALVRARRPGHVRGIASGLLELRARSGAVAPAGAFARWAPE